MIVADSNTPPALRQRVQMLMVLSDDGSKS
jgi:hypothetical protein